MARKVIYPNFCHTDFSEVVKFRRASEERIRKLNSRGMALRILQAQIDPATLVRVRYPDQFWHYREIPVNGQGVGAALAAFRAELKQTYDAEVEGDPIQGFALHMQVA